MRLLFLCLSMGLVGALASSQQRQDNLIRVKLVRPERPVEGESIFDLQFASSEGLKHLNRVNMVKFNELSYIAEVQLGTPAKLFRLLVDSGSGELWVTSNKCTDVNRQIINRYEQQQSSSFNDDGRPVEVTYIDGRKIWGRLAGELAQFGDLVVQNQTFVQVDRIHEVFPVLQYFHVDGLLGLGLSSQTGHPDVESPLKQMMRAASEQSNGNSRAILSLSLNHKGDASSSGELIIGGLDESLYVGSIAWTPLMRPEYWQIRLDNIEMNYLDENRELSMDDHLSVCPHGCDAVTDTGTFVIAGPAKDIQALNDKIGAYHTGGGRYALANCTDLNARLPHFSVTISGRRFTLTPSQYTFTHKRNCFSPFMLMQPKLNMWVLGNMFVGQFYAILDFDEQRLGLAESTYRSDINVVGST